MRPTHRVVVVGVRPAQGLESIGQKLRRFDCRHSVEVQHLVERAVQRAFGGSSVVADDVVHEGVVECADGLQAVDQTPDMVIGVLQEARVHLHLAAQHRLEVLGHVIPGRNLLVAGGELTVRRDHPEFLLTRKRLIAQHVPALIELSRVLVGPFLGHMVRRVGGAGGEVGEERLIRCQRLLLPDPGDGLVGHVLHEVVALFGRAVHLDRIRALIQGRVPLVGLTADETVEVLEATAAGGPRVERPDGTGLPNRHLMALTELRSVVPVELQRACDRRHRVG